MKIKSKLGNADADRTKVHQIKSTRFELIFEEYQVLPASFLFLARKLIYLIIVIFLRVRLKTNAPNGLFLQSFFVAKNEKTTKNVEITVFLNL